MKSILSHVYILLDQLNCQLLLVASVQNVEEDSPYPTLRCFGQFLYLPNFQIQEAMFLGLIHFLKILLLGVLVKLLHQDRETCLNPHLVDHFDFYFQILEWIEDSRAHMNHLIFHICQCQHEVSEE